jgi:hypothetical protein
LGRLSQPEFTEFGRIRPVSICGNAKLPERGVDGKTARRRSAEIAPLRHRDGTQDRGLAGGQHNRNTLNARSVLGEALVRVGPGALGRRNRTRGATQTAAPGHTVPRTAVR